MYQTVLQNEFGNATQWSFARRNEMVDKTPINDMPEAIKIEVIGAISTTFST
jgi:hypothetical protein